MRWCRRPRLLAQTRRDAEAALRRHLFPARHGAGLLGAGAGRRAAGEAAVHPGVARARQGSDRHPERPLVEVGRAARRDDRFRSLGRGGVSSPASSRGRRPVRTRRSAARPSIRIIARKIGQETLLPSLQLAVEDPNSSSSNCGEGYSCSYTNSISWIGLPTPPGRAAADEPAADGAEPAGGVRAPVRQRRDAGDAGGADAAEPQHPRFDSRRARQPEEGSRRRRSPDRQSVHRRDSRDRAAHSARGEGVGHGAGDRSAAGHPGIVRRAHQAALRHGGARVPRRHHARRDAARRPRSDRPQLRVPEERAVPERRRQRRVPRRVAPSGRSGPDPALRRPQPLPRVDAGVLRREAARRLPTATARCSITR